MRILEDNPAVKWLEDRFENQGRSQREIEIARNLLQRGRDIQEVAEDTGLDVSRVAELQTELQAHAV
ncbi:MAG: hypothetical protein FWF81_13370 [Defluviitaleaceae bacterium]|nr:hypothetical protein [Defluviitaleaceae bacterium]